MAFRRRRRSFRRPSRRRRSFSRRGSAGRARRGYQVIGRRM